MTHKIVEISNNACFSISEEVYSKKKHYYQLVVDSRGVSGFTRSWFASIVDAFMEDVMSRTIAFFSIALIFSVYSCTLTSPSIVDELASFQDNYMTTFDIMNGNFLPAASKALTPFSSPEAARARATVPLSGTEEYVLPTAGTSTTGSKTDYPEPGQTSTWTVSPYPPLAGLYLVTVNTTFSSTDARKSQQEQYYIKDGNADGKWTTADTITNEAGVDDSKFRIVNSVIYNDGSNNDEIITVVKFTPEAFKPWAVTDPLDYPAEFTTQADPDASYSSIVEYTRTYGDTATLSFWNGNKVKTIDGRRIYTEKISADRTKLVSSTIVFEVALTEKSKGGAKLAQSVLRQEIVYGWDDLNKTVTYAGATRDTRMQSVVSNYSGTGDYIIVKINSSPAVITTAP